MQWLVFYCSANFKRFWITALESRETLGQSIWLKKHLKRFDIRVGIWFPNWVDQVNQFVSIMKLIPFQSWIMIIFRAIFTCFSNIKKQYTLSVWNPNLFGFWTGWCRSVFSVQKLDAASLYHFIDMKRSFYSSNMV